MIKIGDYLKHYARYRYQQLHGKIPDGMRIHFKDSNPLNVADDNIELRKGCAYSKDELIKYQKHCREYILKEKMKPEYPKEEVKPAVKKSGHKTIGLITIRVNDRTTIQVKPGSNIELIKKRYSMQSLLNARK